MLTRSLGSTSPVMPRAFVVDSRNSLSLTFVHSVTLPSASVAAETSHVILKSLSTRVYAAPLLTSVMSLSVLP